MDARQTHAMVEMIKLTERFMNFIKPFDDALRLIMPFFVTLVLFTILVTAWMFTDREPPFAVLSVEPAAAKPGEFVTIRAKVRRDIQRKCSVSFSSAILDSHGTRVQDFGTVHFTAEMVEEMERRNPGKLAVRIQVPPGMSPGPAALVIPREYVCNRTHVLLPIPVMDTMHFTVLPSQ